MLLQPLISPGCDRPPQPSDVPSYLRSHGELSLRFDRRGNTTALMRRQEGGCLRVRAPRVNAMEAVVINTSGGLCGGDTISQDVVWGDDTSALVTSQAAEKVYGSRGSSCRISTRLTVNAGAAAEWLPQETILFDGARMVRETEIELAESAQLIWSEAVVFGRIARGETFAQGFMRDRVRIRQAGRLIYADVLDLGDEPARLLERAALGGGARGSAVILAVGHDHASLLEALRAVLVTHSEVLSAASAWNGMISARMVSRDPAAMRRCMASALASLRDSRELPRVWRC